MVNFNGHFCYGGEFFARVYDQLERRGSPLLFPYNNLVQPQDVRDVVFMRKLPNVFAQLMLWPVMCECGSLTTLVEILFSSRFCSCCQQEFVCDSNALHLRKYYALRRSTIRGPRFDHMNVAEREDTGSTKFAAFMFVAHLINQPVDGLTTVAKLTKDFSLYSFLDEYGLFSNLIGEKVFIHAASFTR